MQQLYYFQTPNTAPVILDAGSNVGLSVVYFKYLYPNAKIIAFEPDPRTFSLLEKNIERNGLTDIELHNCAISDDDGEMEFHNDEKLHGSLCMGEHSSRGAHLSQKVPCARLSSFIDRSIDLIKMDIEGAENKSIKELTHSGKMQMVDHLLVECHHNVGSEPCFSEILPALEKSDFRYQVSSPLKAPYPKNTSQDVMLFAYRNEKRPLL